MKWFVITCLVLALGCTHTPERLPRAPKSTPVMKVLDPVCGKKIDTGTPRILEYRKGSYYFCSQDCVNRFRSEPETFIGRKVPIL